MSVGSDGIPLPPGFGEDASPLSISSSSFVIGIDRSAVRGVFRVILRRFFRAFAGETDDSGWEVWVTTMTSTAILVGRMNIQYWKRVKITATSVTRMFVTVSHVLHLPAVHS